MYRFVFILNLLLPAILFSQNLIMNPDFEKYARCPDQPGQIYLASHWFSPNIATPDYFNDCSPDLEYGTEFNKKGGQVAHSGHAYAGLQFYYLNRNEFFEYIETLLDSALIAGQLYCISAFVSLGECSYAAREIGAVLSVNELKIQQARKASLDHVPLTCGQRLDDQNEWMYISGIYRAKGKERFLTLGNFSKGDDFWHIHMQSLTDSLFKSSFYFIDDVSLIAIGDSTECNCHLIK
ncbi:MAG: hypothetical protein M0P58_06445 [Bacteroidales bacterium]|nr:hypothetical protein [Bacteroidales bacterium]